MPPCVGHEAGRGARAHLRGGRQETRLERLDLQERRQVVAGLSQHGSVNLRVAPTAFIRGLAALAEGEVVVPVGGGPRVLGTDRDRRDALGLQLGDIGSSSGWWSASRLMPCMREEVLAVVESPRGWTSSGMA